MNILERASLLLKNLFDEETASHMLEVHEQPITSDDETAAVGNDSPRDTSTKNTSLSADDLKFIEDLNATIQRFIPDPNLDVEQLAREMAMSHTIFYQRVRRVIGITPCNLIKNARMNHARDLLTNTSASIAEVADQCGFPNWRYFSTVYKKHWGHSPSKEGTDNADYPRRGLHPQKNEG